MQVMMQGRLLGHQLVLLQLLGSWVKGCGEAVAAASAAASDAASEKASVED